MIFNSTAIHPLLVHLPLILYLVATLLAVHCVLRGHDLGLPLGATNWLFTALWLGSFSGVFAALFGDVSEALLIQGGLDESRVDLHEFLGLATLAIYWLLTLVQGIALWQRRPIGGPRRLVFMLVSLVGAGLLMATTWYGGDLGYQLGGGNLVAGPP